MPATILGDECLCFFRSPAAPPVWDRWRVSLEHGIDDRPASLHVILTGKEHAVAGHGIFQEPLVRQSLSTFFLDHGEFILDTHKLFPLALHPRRECDGRTRGKLETYIVCSIGGPRRVFEEFLWGRL